MVAALLAILGLALIAASFPAAGLFGVGLAFVGLVLTWCGYLALLKRLGRLG
jgi:hypothetical protein